MWTVERVGGGGSPIQVSVETKAKCKRSSGVLLMMVVELSNRYNECIRMIEGL